MGCKEMFEVVKNWDVKSLHHNGFNNVHHSYT